MAYTDLIINGHKFGFSYGDGVIVDPKLAQFENPDYVNALKLACDLMPAVEAYMLLEEESEMQFYGQALNRVGEEELKHVLELYTQIKENEHIQIEGGTMDFINGVAEEYQRRQEKAAIKARKVTERKAKGGGYVYLIQSPTGAYKIGRTVNPSNRLKTFTVKLPFEIELLATIQTPDMYQLESELHNRFVDKRVNGEWYALSPADVEYIKSLAVQNG